MADIELVIKMPEERYKDIMSMQLYNSGLRSGKSLVDEMLTAIRKGTPLPKGHGNLKDTDAILQELSFVSSRPVKSQMHMIEQAHTIIEADKESEVQDEENN